MTGTHLGEYRSQAGTGKAFSVDEIELITMREGKIAGYHIVWDELGFLKQLGMA
jgi:hypothetical protein